MTYLKRIWKYRFILPPAIALLALLYLVGFYALESWWTKQIFISKVNIHWVKTAEAEEAKNPADMTTEEYICYVFGKDCTLALAVSQAENGTRQCDRYNQNTNGTRDWGIFQVNEVHLKKPGWSLSDLTDCKKNVDRAFEIYEAQGFSPWVAYKNKSYLKFL